VKFRTNSCPKFKLSELFVFYVCCSAIFVWIEFKKHQKLSPPRIFTTFAQFSFLLFITGSGGRRNKGFGPKYLPLSHWTLRAFCLGLGISIIEITLSIFIIAIKWITFKSEFYIKHNEILLFCHFESRERISRKINPLIDFIRKLSDLRF
jgi:hypothetical protein